MSGCNAFFVTLLIAAVLNNAHEAGAIGVPGKTSLGIRKLLQTSHPQVLIATHATADTPRVLRATQGSRILQQLGQPVPATAPTPAANRATSAVTPTPTAVTLGPSQGQSTASTTLPGQVAATPKPQQPVPAVTPGSRAATVQPPNAAAAAAGTLRQHGTTSAPAAGAVLSEREKTFKPYLCNTGAQVLPCHPARATPGTAAKLTAGQGRVRDSSLPQRGGADSGAQMAQWAKQQTRSGVTWNPAAQPGVAPPAKTQDQHVLSTQPGITTASD